MGNVISFGRSVVGSVVAARPKRHVATVIAAAKVKYAITTRVYAKNRAVVHGYVQMVLRVFLLETSVVLERICIAQLVMSVASDIAAAQVLTVMADTVNSSRLVQWLGSQLPI